VDWYQYRGTDEAFNFFVQSRNTVPKHKLSYLFRAKNSIHDLDWEKQLDPDKEVVLIPLQYYPENTIDYWVPMDFTDYDGVLYDTVESLSKHYNVVIKEHPAMVTQRPLSFYRRLKHAGKVLFAPALEQSAIALNRADTVLTWNSSVGIEAFFSGKKVITLGKPYYWVKPMVNISKRKDISNLFRIVQKMEHPKDHDKSRLLEHLLCSTVLGDLNHIDKENVAAVARGVREMLEYEQV